MEAAHKDPADKHWDVEAARVTQRHFHDEHQAHLKHVEGVLASFTKKQSDCDQRAIANQASLEQRMSHFEQILGDSLERVARDTTMIHSKCVAAHCDIGKLQKDCKMYDSQHVAVQERLDYLEGVVSDSAYKHTKGEAAHCKVVVCQRELEKRDCQH